MDTTNSPCHQSGCPNPQDPYASGVLEQGLCRSCILENKLASLLPEEFDGDESQDAILERAVEEMAKVWENAKKLREQCEREEAHTPKTMWYLWTQEIRNIMDWDERENGIYTRYFYEPEKQSPPVGTACACDHHGDHAGCNGQCECAR